MLSTKQVRHTLLSLTLPLATLASFTNFSVAKAQITPDNSLGAESSIVTPNVQIRNIPSDRIDGGATRGANLFHSFQEFNINAGRGVYFSNPGGIANILTRVTGGNFSNIQGVLGVLGKANLFLINPNGIVFGPNARLDVGGSFLGSTANSFIFKNGFEFSATNPQAPPLLTINIPIGLGFRNNPGNIITTQSTTQYPILEVPSGKTLALLGGNVSLDGPDLFAQGGRVELGGLSAAGTVGLNGDGSLSFPVGVQRADVSLTNGARVDVRSGGGGSIAVNARNLDISGGSFLSAGIGQGLGTVGSQAGDITLDATGDIKVAGSYVFNNVRSQAVGNAGNINITTGSLSLTDGAQLSASTFGLGNAGNVTVDVAFPVTIAGVGGGFSSGIFSYVETGAVGNGGNIAISSGSFSLSDGAHLIASTYGFGNAGNVLVRTSSPISLAGSNTYIYSAVEASGVGNGGNINIQAASLSLKDGAQLLTLIRQAFDTQPGARGDAGNVTVDVTGPVTIAGQKDGFPSGIISSVGTGVQGNGGSITITSGSFSLTDGGRLNTSTFGQGNAGNVSVRSSGAVELAGSNTTILSAVEASGVGNGGNIDIKAASFSLKDGAQLLTLIREASSTQPGAIGNGGNVTIDVTGSVTIAGVDKYGLFPSAIISDVGTGVRGDGGNITITSGSFSLSNGGRLNASTFGRGNGGRVSVLASDFVSLAGSNTGIFTTVGSTGVGNGGNLRIVARRFNVLNNAEVTVSNLGKSGNAGNLEVIANSINLDDQGKLTANSENGIGGDITLQARDLLLLRRNSEISATSGTPGSAGRDGNININTKFLVAFPGEDSDIVATGFGRTPGSNVQLNASGGIFGIEYRPERTSDNDIVATGTVTLSTPDTDPKRGLFELLETVPDAAQQIAQHPCIKGFGSTFTITGRGGLPTDPKNILSGDNVRIDLVKPVASTVNSTSATQKQASQEPTVKKIIPAQGWIFNEKGEVLLVGYDPTKTGPLRSQPAPASSCAAVK